MRSGLDVFLALPTLHGAVGLLTNVASLTADGRTALRALRESGVNVTVLFSPEHGYYGLGGAGESIADSQHNGIPIYSLYGANRAPSADVLNGLSAVLIDLQDTGNRWYTFLATLGHTLRSCQKAGIPAIVLDRPDPQGGLIVEGNLAEASLFSMVAPDVLPVRYGLTIGEAAHFLNRDVHADLRVVQMDGWRRDMLFADTGLSWCAPSPNMPHAETPLLYSGTCLIEGTNFSEGRGTALPFEQIGAPFVQGEALADVLNGLHLPGLSFTPVWFRPTASKYAGQRCEGVRVHVRDADAVHGFTMGLHLIGTLRALYPAEFAWTDWGGRSGFELLTATARIREAFEHGQPAAEIAAWCADEADSFAVREWWLYPI